MDNTKRRILIDGRELSAYRVTGIGRVVSGFIKALIDNSKVEEIWLALQNEYDLPLNLRNKKILTLTVSERFIKSEIAISRLTGKGVNLYISPYPKLPLFGCHCPAVHIVHDVLDLTHLEYRHRIKAHLDKFRLRRALLKSSLTWYDSEWSMAQTDALIGFAGKNPIVRYPGIDEMFSTRREENDSAVLKKYNLKPGYILTLGNGLPHKNLGILLKIAVELSREIVFVGVSIPNKQFWLNRFDIQQATWIEFVKDEDLSAVIRGAFCLAQPSTEEGYGYPPLEAMACGTPIVISDIPVLNETTGRISFSAAPNKPDQWVKCLKKLENEHIRSQQIVRGLKWVKKFQGEMAWNLYVDDIINLIGESYKHIV